MLKNPAFYLVSLFLFAAGLGGGLYLSQYFHTNAQANTTSLATAAKNCIYQYTSPVRCALNIQTQQQEYTGLRNDLVDYFAAQQKKGVLTTGAVYFRDLQNGPIMAINAQTDFAPASLLKVPLMITYYKKAEKDPSLLQQKMTITPDITSLQQNIVPKESAQVGKTYTIDQLITLSIVHSDDISWEALLTYLRKHYSEDDFVATLNDMGIMDPRKSTDHQYLTVQEYASIFRALYNSSYLNPEMSNKALKLLTQSDFQNGLVAGVPDGIEIAHKYGERKEGDEQQLHDCGIVYYTPDPYLLCIMTRGHTIEDLEPVIQYVSKHVYDEVEKRN